MNNKNLIFLKFLTLLLLTEAARQEILSKDELNKFLFNDPKSTILDDYEKGIPVKQLSDSSDDENKFDYDKDIVFGFLSQQKRKRQEFTYENRADINSDVVDITKPFRVVIHGWVNNSTSPMITTITEAYLDKMDVNLMVVDWSKLAFEAYPKARELTAYVGKKTAELLKYLIMDAKLVDLDKVYLIGHSLGGHTAGFVGKELQKLGVGKVPVLFALDPAGPLFSQEGPERRLDKEDAKFVIVLHTSTLLGFTKPLGHADFYPNYGFSQPGCNFDPRRSCAHSRAYMYFADAIREGDEEEKFWAVKCHAEFDDIEAEKCDPSEEVVPFEESLEKMGDNGLFYFETNSEKPWSKGKRHVHEYRANKTSIIEISWKIIFVTILFACIAY